MVNIETTNPTIEKYLTRICAKIIDAGGFIHPNVKIIEHQGNFSIEKTGAIEERHFIKVPHTLLVPYLDFDLEIQGNDIVMADYASNTERPQYTLFDDILSLYNESGKMKHHLESCPWINYSKSPQTVDLLLKDRGSRDIKLIKSMIGNEEYAEELALFSFFKSRMAFCRINSRQNPFTEVFLPIIEFLNHHPLGAGYDNLYLGKEEKGFMAISPVTPIEGSNECFASYGRFDAVDCFLHYGFVDHHAYFTRSIPMRIKLKEFGDIVIKAQNAVVPVNERPEHLKQLGLYLPLIQKSNNNNAMMASHLIIPKENAPHSLRRVLHEILLKMAPDIDDEKALETILEIETEVLLTNLSHYDRLEQSVDNDICPAALRQNIQTIVNKQKNIIQSYIKMHSISI